jgi:GPH family glycoside/pentoside/hexuronide:cation symporter
MRKKIKKSETTIKEFGIRDSLAYAAGDVGCNMSFALKSTMALFWTQAMGLGTLYSLLIIILQIWDAINDPLIGSIIDADKREYRKRNKFLQYIFIGSIGLIFGGALCFIPMKGAELWAKIVVFMFGYILWDAFYTVANVPYGSLLSLISDKAEDRASLSAWRSIGSGIGNMIPAIILPFLIYDESKNLIPERIFFVAIFMGVLGFICFQFMIKNTTIRVTTDVKCNEEQPKFNVLKAMGNFLKNRPAVGATLAAMGMFIGIQGAATAITVSFQRYYKIPELAGIIQIFTYMPMLIFTPLARKMVVKYGKKELSTLGALCYIVGACLMFIITPKNVFLDLGIYIAASIVCSFGMGVYSTISWAMMGDAIDYNEWKNGTREEGVVYSLHSFFRKLAQGVGPAIAILIMASMGYVNNAITNTDPYIINPITGDMLKYLPVEPGQVADAINVAWLSDETAIKIRSLVAILYLVAGIFQFIGLRLVYNLDKKTLNKMNEELKVKHTTE